MNQQSDITNEDPHELFQCVEDHWNWEKYIQQCDRIDLDEDQRKRSKDSFRYLQKTLGTGFLRRAFNERHPFYTSYFCNAAPPARLSLIRFAESIRGFQNAPNFRAILKRIKRRLKTYEDFQDITEAMSVVEVAHRFLLAGFDVELEPLIQVNAGKGDQHTKKPDFKIIDRENGQVIVVEVSRMMASDNQRLTSDTYQVVFNNLVLWGMQSDPEAFKDILQPRHILPRAIIHRAIERRELNDIAQKIRSLVERVRATGEFGELIIPDTLEVGIGPYDNHEIAKVWARERGMKEGDIVQGAIILSDEVARAKSKIRKKLKQLPEDLPGMVVIEAKENLLFFAYDIRWLALTFGEEMTRHPNLLRTVMFHSFVDGSSESTSAEIGAHTFSRRVRRDSSTEQSLTLRNVDCGLPVSAKTLKQLDAIFVPAL